MFRHGASNEEMGRLMHDGGGGGGKEEEEWFGSGECKGDEEAEREPTAFNVGGTERVFVGEPAAAVLARVEAAGRKGGYRMRRREGKSPGGSGGPVYVEDEEGGGGLVAKVSVFRLADAVSVVEVVKGDADAALFWTELLEPAMKPPALS